MSKAPAPDAVRLVPCPFCGGDAEIIHIDEGENAGGSCVSCTKCQASSNVEFEFKENFVSNWNRRAPAPAPATARGGDARHPLPDDLQGGAHDEAMAWVTSKCMAIRRDNGEMDYSLGAVIAAFEAGKAAALASQPQATGGAVEREAIAWEWIAGRYPNDAPSDLAYDANEMVDAFMAGSACADGMAKALARIAGEQQYRSGYCQTDIAVEPALTAEEAQASAREALSPILAAIATQPAPSPGVDHADIAARLHPALFSSDERTAHMAASPYAVSIKRAEAVAEVERVLSAAATLSALPAAPSIQKGDEG